MKFWHKVSLLVLITFILALDICVFAIINKSWVLNLSRETERASSEQILLANNILENLNFVLHRGVSVDEAMYYDVASSYGSHYKKQGIYIDLWMDSQQLYSATGEYSQSLPENIVEQIELKDSHFIQITKKLPSPYEHLTLVYQRNIDSLYQDQAELNRFFILINFIVGISLSVILYFIIRFLTKPLQLLSNTTMQIAKGDYSKRVHLKGKDEFSVLAENFNQMAEAVEQHVNKVTQLVDEKQRLVDNVAHELRTPLTSMKGFADFLMLANCPEEERIVAGNYIKSESVRLNQLSQKLLDISSLNQISVNQKTIEIEKLFQKVMDITKPHLLRYEQVLTVTDNQGKLMGDFDLLVSLLVNLVENAIYASRQKSEIELKAFRQNQQVILEVSDHGCGMEKEQIEKVFEAFYRVDKSRSREYGGAGLGLSLCKQIVEAHGASIKIDSNIDKGTKVQIYFTTS